ncbi:50S ribosomal protein L20 [Candidatus Roizmanbacteria bacterium RIFCSPHIGHO2_01_FULL_39_8]|uniref:Large ribosomal subunit protein bL20 n=2 Tax=Candidatus Roizmaniibacteriota TaxID=1752723 RepID=A0A1F7GL62_9BACT|nr:MAG: 50S ribosomal protein L20 [Candidatus Roizmanbacteria bacterium RIFCSPHIGHO2_01_FULL_39_8]OGK35452.1 MAG: 50S ribosomal protein L20 [Candidatus Roizmanbacteria bacterium RIFCSPHIGHO2_12_FULL_39_8]
MVRVKSGIQTKKKHKKVLKLAKGYWMTRHKQFKKAKEAVLHAGAYAYTGRKDKKHDFRKLWIIRLNSMLRTLNSSYSKFIAQLKSKKIELDRKVLAQIAVEYPKVFEKIVDKVK